jgi:pyruvate dehydrogenase E2 component (dihydrolipoamide acetyltransferase)
MAGGTFSITNIGVFGVDAGAPILNPGESGILCVGQIARRPWVVGEGSDGLGWATNWLPDGRMLITGPELMRVEADGSRLRHAAILNDPALALLF